jgi:hypothetical protein
MNPPPTQSWRKHRRRLAGLAVCLVLIGGFYAEENWRGQNAWENCKRLLKAQGVEPNWAKYIPDPVPDDENIFGVPEMQRWFGGNGIGWANLAKDLPSESYPGVNIDTNTARMVVARVTIGLHGTPLPDGFAALRWDDPTSRTQAANLLNNAIGPIAKAPQSVIGVGLMLRTPEQIQPAQLFLQCQTAPTEKDLQEFLPDTVIRADAGLSEKVLKFEPDDHDSYRVTMPVLARAGAYLAWSDGLEPQFALIHQALQRPSSRIQGYYGNPDRIPGPNFRSTRTFVQTLGARAQCHLLLGQPGEALSDLTLMHDFSHRILEEYKPMTLLATMINVAVRGLYVQQIAEGLRLHAWRESELAALEEQLKTIDVVPPVKQAFVMEDTSTFRTLESVPSAGLVKRSFLGGLCPRGWGYEHIVARVQLDFARLASIDTASQVIFADKVKAADQKSQAIEKGWWAYTFVGRLDPSPFLVVCKRTAYTQTKVNQAVVACALERYHLALGKYPENLDALLPKFLDKIPHDVIGGQPPHYSRAADGTFILYSIGWNGLDNGGVRSQSLQAVDGNWVWSEWIYH